MLAKPAEVRALQEKYEAIIRDVAAHVASIVAELSNPESLSPAKIILSLGHISRATHKFLLFLPEVGATRDGFIRDKGPLGPHEAHVWSELANRVWMARTWFALWPQVEALVRRQIARKRNKLFVTNVSLAQASQLAVYDTIFDDLGKILNPNNQTEFARDHGCFADIPFRQSVFIELMHAAHRVLLAKQIRHPSRFLDVGCGGGLKVLSAAKYFSRTDGLEFDPAYVEAARELIDQSRLDTCRVIHADALNFDAYDEYDVIYFYRPMRHIKPLQELEDRIVRTARPGTLIVAPYKIFESRHKSLGCARIDGALYATATSQSEANSLRRRATMTGPDVTATVSRPMGIWDPIISVSQRMGYISPL